jgi:hypothetical protein
MITKIDFYIDTIQNNRINYVVQYPDDYSTDKKYPLIVFTHGDGSKAGTGINRMLSEGLCGFLYNGLNIPFIVVSPQTPYQNFDSVGDSGAYKPGYFVNEMAQVAIKRYSVDTKRVYITGLSMSGSSADLALAYYPNVFAAGVNVSSWPPSYDEASKIKGAIWHIKGNADRQGGAPEGNIAYIEKVRGFKQSPDARYTIFSQPGHYAWEATYTNTPVALDPKYPGSAKQENIFNWLLKFSLDGVVPEEPPIEPEEPEIPNPPINIDSTMTITDNTGKVLLGKIEAENYTSTNKTGVFTENTTDEGGGKNVGWINLNDYFNYSINIPIKGNYKVDLRLASTANAQIQIKSGSTVLATVEIPTSGSWQSWKTISTIVPLEAGLQTITIQATKPGFNFNWLNISLSSVLINGFLVTE